MIGSHESPTKGKGYGQILINTACNYTIKQGAEIITVETLAPNESDENYLKTYRLYDNIGFLPFKPATARDWFHLLIGMVKEIPNFSNLKALSG